MSVTVTLAGATTSAQNIETRWVSPTTGIWSQAGRWSNGVPNGANYNAIVDVNGANPYQVGLDGDFSVNRLVVDAPMAMINGTSNSLLVANVLDLRQGTYVVRNLSGARISVAPGATFNLHHTPMLSGGTIATDVSGNSLEHVRLFRSLAIDG